MNYFRLRLGSSRNEEGNLRKVSLGLPSVKFKNNVVVTAKYNLVTFFPKFFLIQFSKAANVFFGMIALIQQIPDVSPTGRYTTLLPLIFILFVAAVKELFEDYKRHADDREINNKKCLVYRNNTFQKVTWKDVKVGEIVKILNGQPFPADLVLLSSSEPQSMCYVETAMLDGETNLKIRQAITETTHLTNETDFQDFNPTFECDLPNNNLYEFNGSVQLKPETAKLSLSISQVLLRGCVLRNTEWAVGVVVYTGHETKIMKNTKVTPIKRSGIERTTNIQIMYLFTILLVVAIISTIGHATFQRNNPESALWYVPFGSGRTSFQWALLTFIVLYNNLVPISLMVTLEVVKYVQATFINEDLEMYDPVSDTPGRAKTSNLNEELGQIEYIFSDKTGTLTQNIMDLKRVTVAGNRYGDNAESDHFEDKEFTQKLKDGDKSVKHFVRMMSVCHTVVPEITCEGTTSKTLVTDQALTKMRKNKNHKYKNLDYQASSPDESAIIKATKNLGYVFCIRTPETIMVDELGDDQEYEILAVLEFTSNRKRMSVIVKDVDGQIWLMCKGADDVILSRLAKESKYEEETVSHLKEYASEGLRTLCFAQTKISKEVFEKWNSEHYQPANSEINDRESKLEIAYDKIEQNLHLLGATAIEDKLQDGVPETIDILMRANIKIWVLTGDKVETAVNIANSCKLINPAMKLFVLDKNDPDVIEAEIESALQDIGEENLREADKLNFGLVIAGNCLDDATKDVKKFLDVALSCKAVLCCRVSPIQKADIVELVKSKVKKVTLAIGDGGNDVSMIQSAHVGVGISGQEGLQAANASDYSIAQFRFLKPLLLKHGNWNYTRLSKCVLYSFYKNICLYMVQFWYAFYNGFSGQIFFDKWTISLYNVVFTALQPFAIGIFDRTFSSEVMYKYPELYVSTQKSHDFNSFTFWQMVLNALYHSAVLFFLPCTVFGEASLLPNGKMHGYLFLGNFVFTFVVITVSLKALLEFNSWTKVTHISVWGSICFWFVFCMVYQYMWPATPFGEFFYLIFWNIAQSPHYWMSCILFPFIALFRDVVWKIWSRTFDKSSVRNQVRWKINEQEKYTDGYPNGFQVDRETANLLHPTAFTAQSSTHNNNKMSLLRTPTKLRPRSNRESPKYDTGFAFSQTEEREGMSQVQMIRTYSSSVVRYSKRDLTLEEVKEDPLVENK